KLVASGELIVDHGRGRNHVNHYRIVLPIAPEKANTRSSFVDEKEDLGFLFPDEKRGTDVPLLDAEKRNARTGKEEHTFLRSVINSQGNIDSTHRRSRAHARSRQASAASPSFERFYAAYPRHIAKAAALKAWLKLAPDPTTEAAIIADVQRRASG